jgi:putative aminopeptidase FrvX
VPTIVIGIPTRYEHSAYNWAKLSDVENAIKLTLALLRRLDKDTIASFSQF